MAVDNRFMPELVRIVNGALRLDTDKVRNYTAFLAEKLEKSGDEDSAKRLRKMLEETDQQLRPAGVSLAPTLPVDAESRFPLVDRFNLRGGTEPPLILSQEQWDVVNEFVSVTKSQTQTDTAGMSSSLSLLIYGPPGTGKNRLARYIANELGLELYIARLDGLISSFLGSTSKNIRALFDFAAKTPCILFLDEFDAIAKLRGDTQELGELKRVVNSFIQNLDTIGAQSIIIAATNHRELLDSAIWRRFSYRLALDFPTADMRERMWHEFLHPIEFEGHEAHVLVDLSEGFSGSDIRQVCERLQRRRITAHEDPTLRDAFQILQNIALGEGEERRFLSRLRGMSQREIAIFLRDRNARLYSHSALADLFGVSKATAHRWWRGGKRSG